MALLILAGLQVIPADVYEAAKVDGATAWQRFTQITLPLVKPALMVAVLFRTLDVLRIYDLPAILTGGGGNGTHHDAVDPGGRSDPAGLQQRGGPVHDHLPAHLPGRVHLREVPRRNVSSSQPQPKKAKRTWPHCDLDTGRPDDSAPDRPPDRRGRGWPSVRTYLGVADHRHLGPGAVLLDGRHGVPRRRLHVRHHAVADPRHLGQLHHRVLDTTLGNHFGRALVNSLIIGVVTTVIALLVGVFAAYALARLKFRGKFLVARASSSGASMFPGVALVTPLFQLFTNIGWLGHYQALIIPDISFVLPLTVYTLTAFFREMPWELEESARIDGCTPGQAFRKVILPLAAPGLFTTAILAFIAAWNEYLLASQLSSRRDPAGDGGDRPVHRVASRTRSRTPRSWRPAPSSPSR